MIVEVIGGSGDGRTYEAADGARYLAFPVRRASPDETTVFQRVEVPIRKWNRPNGERIRAIDGIELDRKSRWR